MTVDDGGSVDVSDGGFLTNQGPAPGISHHLGSSGAAHAGLGGRGACSGSKTCRTFKNLPYGSMYHPRNFGSGGHGNQGGIGGGILEIEVHDILRVDGAIKANSLDKDTGVSMSGASGGSGGSILIRAGAYVGGHTGSIEAHGGSGDNTGGSGSGGRVAIYYANNVTHGQYLGSYFLQGGPVGTSGAEAGAAGTAYTIHTETAHSTLYVNNYGRLPLYSEIRNIGRRLDLRTSTALNVKSEIYQADNGIIVTSSGAIYDDRYSSDSTYYAIGYLFDQSLSSHPTHYYRNAYASVTLTFDLKKVYFLNVVRVHVFCGLTTKFKVTGQLEGSTYPITTSYVLPPSPCTNSDPYVEIPVRQQADGLIFYLVATSSSSDASLSEIELYVEPIDVYDRYNHRELDSAKTWIEEDDGPHDFTELTVIGGSQLACMSAGNLTSPVKTRVEHLHGDTTGYIHIGYAQSMDIAHTNPDVPVSTRVYENGELRMPHRTFFWNVEMISSGKVTGIEDLFVFDSGYVRFDSNSSLGEDAEQSQFHLKSLHVQDGGTFELRSHEKDAGMDIKLGNLTVYGGGFFKSNDRFNLTADHLFAIHSGGEINLDHGGYETMETRGPVNGYVPSEGPGQGYGEVGSSSGGSGGGHGGSGGRSSSQVKVGLPYGSIYEPVDYGSTGGYGRDYGQLYFGNEAELNTVVRLGLGGRGGGAMKAVARHIFIDGKLTANGENGDVHAGGGSGGSIWLDCEELDGDGEISANGGKGQTYAGGGAGGRVAIYHHRMHDFNGTISAYGGTGYSSYSGGAGTVYLERIEDEESDSDRRTVYKILKVDNKGINHPPTQNILNGVYDDITEIGGVTWLWHSSHEYQFNETHVHGNAHLAVLSDTERETVVIDGGSLYGDRSAVIHIGMNQSLSFDWVDVYFAANVMLYRHGWMAIPSRLSMRDVWFEVRGTFSHSLELFVDSGGSLSMWSEGNSADHPVGTFKFTDMTVRANGEVVWWTSSEFPEMTVLLRDLRINAGGEVITNQLILEAENVTIDTSGQFHADGGGYAEGPGVGRPPLSNYPSTEGASGGAHGGRGGRGYYGLYSSQGYGSVHTPRTMGSGGGTSSGTAGSGGGSKRLILIGNVGAEVGGGSTSQGFGSVCTPSTMQRGLGTSSGTAGSGGGTILMTIRDTLRVEGELRVNGEAGTGYSGGGSGGSILGYLNHLDGAGSVQALGGRVFLQDNFNVTNPIRKLLVDNDLRATKSRVTKEETLSTAGVRVGDYQYELYNGIVAKTTASHYYYNYYTYYLFSHLFQQSTYGYVSVSTAPKITLQFPLTTYLEALKIYPICSGLGSGTSFQVSSRHGATVTSHSDGYLATSGCNSEYNNQKIFIRRDVDEVIIDLYLGSGRAGLKFMEIIVTEDPDLNHQLQYSIEAESLLIGEEQEEGGV
ncbi:hypothetical protein BSL78_01925 [Apostichopus japonicus]|uniref:Tenascin-X n=1 Tax=Stichopus japonicus TaxID=307972 RepID=A0A2G8LLQ4_STIJA|nr:hypothetical protein BSL78_01925 [Apostichopus japonicus]